MPSYLFAVPDGGGTTPPQLSLAAAMVARGHDVRVLCDPVLEPEIEAIGARHVSWTRAPHRFGRSIDTEPVKAWEAKTPIGQFARFRDEVMFGPAAAYAEDVTVELARRPADVVVCDLVLAGAQLAAEAAGVPFAVVGTTIYVLPAPGLPPLGPGWKPARGPLGRVSRCRCSAASSGGCGWAACPPSTRPVPPTASIRCRTPRPAQAGRPVPRAHEPELRFRSARAARERALRRTATGGPGMGRALDRAGGDDPSARGLHHGLPAAGGRASPHRPRAGGAAGSRRRDHGSHGGSGRHPGGAERRGGSLGSASPGARRRRAGDHPRRARHDDEGARRGRSRPVHADGRGPGGRGRAPRGHWSRPAHPGGLLAEGRSPGRWSACWPTTRSVARRSAWRPRWPLRRRAIARPRRWRSSLPSR